MDRKAIERVYVGGKATEGVGDGPDCADMEGDGGCEEGRRGGTLEE